MPRKPTINRDSVFRRTNGSPPAVTQGTGDAQTERHQTAVWLSDAEIDWLDHCCQDIRRRGWRGVTRSAVIRSLIQAAVEKQIRFSDETVQVTDEADLKELLKSRYWNTAES